MSVKRFAFRADASLEIGTGHVMRCLTLADKLRERGADCVFFSRAHPGHLNAMISGRGYAVHSLTTVDASRAPAVPGPAHAHWLGVSWQADAEECLQALASARPDWWIVDHYALDADWESVVVGAGSRLMVIDDLADRPHRADLLLDQNLGHTEFDYRGRLPANAKLLLGPRFALLRPEFGSLRPGSLERRAQGALDHLLICMGGVDRDDATGRVLRAIRQCPLPLQCRISIVMGPHAPWIERVQAAAAALPWKTEVLVGVSDMAALMASCDLAIGAAGTMVWERCCLGLPSLAMILADNQRAGAAAMSVRGAAVVLAEDEPLEEQISREIEACLRPGQLRRRQVLCSQITAGQGASLVADELGSE